MALSLFVSGMYEYHGVEADASEKENVIVADEINYSEEPVVVEELINERTENTNTYLMSDGSKKVEIYSGNIRYEEDGELIEYDASLTTLKEADITNVARISDNVGRDYMAVNTKGDSRQYYPKELSMNTGVIMKKDDYVISFAPGVMDNENAGMSARQARGSTNAQTYTGVMNENEVIYSSDETTIKYQYISLPNGVKENIILKERPDTNCVLSS